LVKDDIAGTVQLAKQAHIEPLDLEPLDRSVVIAGLDPAIHTVVPLPWTAGIGERSDAVLRTAMPSGGEAELAIE
jgi:hypothetical protein